MPPVDLRDDPGPHGSGKGGSRDAEEGQHAVIGNLPQLAAETEVFPEFFDALGSIDVHAENRKHLFYSVLCGILRHALGKVAAMPPVHVA